jgi:DNA-binding CsgD family transcriptional regulator
MLIGREQERLALDRLVAQARDGRSGALALVGEAGIGKTALLAYAEQRAEGMRILRARGIESEAEVPFAGLAELLRPALGALDRIPGHQAEALAGALALAPATAGDRFAIGAATLSLLSAWAEAAPLAVLVDDVHLLDGSSAEALLFAVRRLVADPVAVLIAAREGERSMLDGSDIRVLRVAGLGRAEAAELLAGASVAEATLERLHSETGGNPLALLELAPEADRLAEAGADGPMPISSSIAAAFMRRFGRMPEPARRMLVLAAASDGAEPSVLARAAGSLGLSVDDLAAAETAGLVRLDPGGVEFWHPLARSAVYTGAGPPERRDAHAALAAALPDRDADRRAWHLAAAAVGPDRAAASALAQAGERARARSAYSVAAAAFERGARLAPSDEARAGLLCDAAESASLAGAWERAPALLDDAARCAANGDLAVRIDYLSGQIALRRGPVMDGYRLLVGAAERVVDSDPEAAVVMLAQAVHGAFYAADTAAMLAAADRASAIAEREGSRRGRFFAAMSQGIALVAAGQGESGAGAVRGAVRILEESDELRDDPLLAPWAALGPLFLREAEAGRGLVERALERARARTAVGVLPFLLHHLARDLATTDQWPASAAGYDEAIRLARESGQRAELAAALAGLAWLEARQGREADCRAHAAEGATLCGELGLGFYGVWTIQARGDLELGLGHAAEALGLYSTQLAAMAEHGIADVDLSPAPEQVDACLRLGRRDEARATADAFAAAAEAKGQPWALARAARCRGQLAATAGEADECFAEALALHARTPDAFELGRTRLAYGIRLRRERKRVRARSELRSALEIFEALGARPWAEQANAELAASGETVRRRDASTLDELTPQELQIARLLASGQTTREAAAAVFLSPKTVEYHLHHVYLKLGINSRKALAAALEL